MFENLADIWLPDSKREEVIEYACAVTPTISDGELHDWYPRKSGKNFALWVEELVGTVLVCIKGEYYLATLFSRAVDERLTELDQ
jgi:hypothetical protein